MKASPDVGARIRALRQERGLTLRALAERCNLSVNAIGLIERGRNSPTVASLQSLATAIGVEITDFFQDSREHATVFVSAHQRLTATGGGLMMESLGIGLQNQQLEPFLVTIEPNAQEPEEPITHPGQEFVYCMSGSVTYEINEVEHALSAGDSILFDASQLHRFHNNGSVPAQLLVVFQASEGQHLARDRHLGSDHQSEEHRGA